MQCVGWGCLWCSVFTLKAQEREKSLIGLCRDSIKGMQNILSGGEGITSRFGVVYLYCCFHNYRKPDPFGPNFDFVMDFPYARQRRQNNMLFAIYVRFSLYEQFLGHRLVYPKFNPNPSSHKHIDQSLANYNILTYSVWIVGEAWA